MTAGAVLKFVGERVSVSEPLFSVNVSLNLLDERVSGNVAPRFSVDSISLAGYFSGDFPSLPVDVSLNFEGRLVSKSESMEEYLSGEKCRLELVIRT